MKSQVSEIISIASESKSDNGKNLNIDFELNNLFDSKPLHKILLISPPDVPKELFSWETCQRGRYSNYPPYGLLSLATRLKSSGIEVQIINLNNEVLHAAQVNALKDFNFENAWSQPLINKIDTFKPDLVALTCMFSQTHESLLAVIEKVNLINNKIPVAVGGVHITNSFATLHTKQNLLLTLKHVDLFFLFEGDLSFPIFVDVVNKKIPSEKLCQVAVKSSTGELLEFNQKAQPSALELDVIPDHALLPPKETSKWGTIGAYTFLKPNKTIYANVLANRGCRAMCTFCSVRGFNGLGVRRRSIQSVVDELKILVNELGVEHIMWLDDDFFYDHQQTLLLFNEITKANLNFTWDCTNGVLASSCTEEIVAGAADAGCIGLNIGMESGNPQILKQIKKPASVATLLKAARVLVKEPRIFSRAFLMLGFPNEKYGQVKDTFDVAKEMGLDWYQIQVLQPLPNTPIYQQMVAEGFITETNFSEIRYSGGTYGRMAKRTEQGRDMLEAEFDNIFTSNNLDAPITVEDYEKAWAYMTYNLNYEPIPKKAVGLKANQIKSYLSHVSKVIAPNDPFAIYHSIQLSNQLGMVPDPEEVSRLQNILNNSERWVKRFSELNLTLPLNLNQIV